jgi:hypothetical protein
MQELIKQPGCFSCKYYGKTLSNSPSCYKCSQPIKKFGDPGAGYIYAGDRMMELRRKKLEQGVICEKNKGRRI